MSYCGSQLVKVLSGLTYRQVGFSTDADFGSFLAGTLIPQAQQIIDSYVNHDFSNHTGGTITADGTGKNYVTVDPEYAPLTGLTSLSIDGAAKAVGDFKVYDQYVAYDDGTFPKDEQNVVLVADYGYSSVPADVSYVCASICAGAIREIVRSKMVPDLITQLMESERTSMLESILAMPRIFTKENKEMLQKYQYVQIGVG